MDNGMIFVLLMGAAFLLVLLGCGVYQYLTDKMSHERELLRMEKGLAPTPTIIEHYLCDDCNCEHKALTKS